MPTLEHLKGAWREWRHARIATLSRPYGWPALVSQDWLEEDSSGIKIDGLPGSWGVESGQVVYTPPTEGPNLSVDGKYPTGPVVIPPGRNQSFGHYDSVPVFFGDREVETLERTNNAGERIYGVRVRDPHEAAKKDFSSLTAYDYDPSWRIPVKFNRVEYFDIEQETVEKNVRESTITLGTLSFDLQGKSFECRVMGREGDNGLNAVLHVRDLTSGDTTYGAGRIVNLEWADEAQTDITLVDFNYLIPLPCAFTNFVTCPIPPPENTLDVAITVGEKRPAETLERVSTYENSPIREN